MTNRQLIKSAHIGVLMVLLACGLLVVAGKAGIRSQNQNQNSNQNSNMNTNTNTNTNTRANSNRSGNRNSGNAGEATGGQVGMGNLSSQDRDFLMDAAMGGMMEVEMGRMAAQLGSSDAVKQFGRRMVDDHSKANTELTSLASSKGITLPTALDQKHRQEMSKMQRMKGADFDRAYMKLMVSDHTKDVSEFEKQSTRGTDPDLKAFASKTLPTLQEHLQLARSINDAGRGGNDNSNRNDNSNSNSNRNNNGNSNSNHP
ncbi:MAG TPA: DUF4142 domain-containing protein [Pyrinomonadaceae bacterium]|nr:DUF4142 domain-containing protein [Pyrinomonadaceae bacterium]